MKVRVTQENIERGVPSEMCRCPIALALYDAVALLPTSEQEKLGFAKRGRGKIIEVEADEVRFPMISVTPPAEVARFIYCYDGALPVKPFEFELDVPEVTQ